ncbi:MAG TPA: hypothetical protein VN026_03430 [Bacteroidia bacterium]|nr:hypothetical protein [Bacteroidia bacterium]
MNYPKEAIGGYFELELKRNKLFHENAILLNTGRNALELILRTEKINKIYLPYYTCDVLLEPINKLNIKIEFYNINEKFEPIFLKQTKNKEAFLYINYFGLKESYIKKIRKSINNLIIDNSLAFYSKPVKGLNTFYSCRKFFGVPDGSILYMNKKPLLNFKHDVSNDRVKHLMIRLELKPEEGFDAFRKNEEELSDQPIKEMSTLTKKLLQNIDYLSIKKIREQNFSHLHKKLKAINELSFNVKEINGPMNYPLLIKDGFKIRRQLIQQRIFVPCFWENLPSDLAGNGFEKNLSRNLLPLPIDQRYSQKEMKLIANLILENHEY